MVMKHYQPLKDTSKLHPDTVIRTPTVLQLFPVSRTTWENGVKSGKYPAPIRLSERGVGWKLRDILELIESSKENSPAAA